MPAMHAERARDPKLNPPTNPGKLGSTDRTTDGHTWSKQSIRHSELRRATMDGPLHVRLTTPLLHSKMRRGTSYIGFRVRGDDRSYTYEPENRDVENYLHDVTQEHGPVDPWFLLTATGREGDARLQLVPLAAQRGGSKPQEDRTVQPAAVSSAAARQGGGGGGAPPREKYVELRNAFAEAHKRIMGTELDPKVLRSVLFLVKELGGDEPGGEQQA